MSFAVLGRLGAAALRVTFLRGVLFASGNVTLTPPESSTVCLTAAAFGLRVLVLRATGFLADDVINDEFG